MPIGTSKVGALGGLVPGGTVTFNSSGNWTVPPGVKKVSITGRGGTGNPGNSGTAGNPGNLGTGGGGGGGGTLPGIGTPIQGRPGGAARAGIGGDFSGANRCGGSGGPTPASGQTGNSGNAGSAGSTGSAGNPGQPSSGLGNTFPGGAAGNAGNAGSAGNGGSGGNGGSPGANNPVDPQVSGEPSGGSGGNGGGSGTPGGFARPVGPPAPAPTQAGFSGSGGGGAGATNDGAQGVILFQGPTAGPFQVFNIAQGGRGGNTSNYSVPIHTGPNSNQRNKQSTPGPSPQCAGAGAGNFPTNATGGVGGYGTSTQINANNYPPATGGSSSIGLAPPGSDEMRLRTPIDQPGVAIFSPYPSNSPAFPAIRSGGGGGAGGRQPSCVPRNVGGMGGGGGGGRGNEGNAGGAGGAGGTGGAGTPQTFNCVTVTPGATVPITVGSPGGQVVISWNPQ